MTRILSLVCGLALAGSTTAQDRPNPPRGTPPDRPKAEGGRDIQPELERLRAQVRELEVRLAKDRGGDRRPDVAPPNPNDRRPDAAPPKADDRRPAPREVAPMPRPKGDERGPAPKAEGPMGGRGGFGPGPGGFGPGGPGGFGPGGFGKGGPNPPFSGPGAPGGLGKGPGFGPGGFTPPAAQGRGTDGPGPGAGDVEQRLNRIIDELERLRDDLHRSQGQGPRR